METQASHPTAWRFTDLLDIEHIQRLQDAFAEAHHVATVITDPHGAPLTRISEQRLLSGRTGSELELSLPHGVAIVDSDRDVWTGVAAIGLDGVHLAEWRVSRAPDMEPERFDRVCGFLEQAAELVSHQARMQAQLNEALADRRRAEAERERLDHHLRLASGMVAVGRLAGGIAHDFGNLLTAITAYAEQLTDRLADPESPDEPAVRILAAADRAIGLVHRLLEVARQSPGRAERVDVVDLIAETASLLSHTLPASIRVTHSVSGDVRPIEGDGSCLHAAFLNLGINGGHAMGGGGGELVFTVRERHLDAGPHVEVRVRDTGQGMDPETRRRIFDPFFTTRADAGTGLGLTQARSCVESHGGRIEVESEPGRGSVFTVLLPVSRAARQVRREAC